MPILFLLLFVLALGLAICSIKELRRYWKARHKEGTIGALILFVLGLYGAYFFGGQLIGSVSIVKEGVFVMRPAP